MKMRAPRNQKEKRIQSAVVRNLRVLGCFVTSFSQPRNTMQTPGIPDLFVTHSLWRISLWVEMKAPGGKLTTAQEVWHREAKQAGQNVMVATCTDDVLREFVRLGAPITI